MPARSFRFSRKNTGRDTVPSSKNTDVDTVLSRSQRLLAKKAAIVTPSKSLRPSRIRKQTVHDTYPLEENGKNNNDNNVAPSDNTSADTVLSRSQRSLANKAEIVTPSKSSRPSRIRKQTVHYTYPLEQEKGKNSDSVASLQNMEVDAVLSRSQQLLAKKEDIITPSTSSRPSRIRKQTDRYTYPLEENEKNSDNDVASLQNLEVNAVLSRSQRSFAKKAEIVTPSKLSRPSRIRKQTDHYTYPLEGNGKNSNIVAPSDNMNTDMVISRSQRSLAKKADLVTPSAKSSRPSRIRKQTVHYTYPLEENGENNDTVGIVAPSDNTSTDTVLSRSQQALARKEEIVSPSKSLRPSRIRKQTDHYNPLQENRKPQHHRTSTRSPAKKKQKKTAENARQVSKCLERKEEYLILEPVSKELLCEHCNFGGDLMQCHHASIGGTASCGIGCAKVVHPFCVGRESIPEGDWLCTACSVQHGYKVKIPKELREKDISLDYGCVFTSKEQRDREYQQMERELREWGKEKETRAVVEPKKCTPHNYLFGSISSDEEIKEDDTDDDTASCSHSIGPCDVCKEDGDLIRCHSHLFGIGCGKTVHTYCVFRDEMPEGDWVCENCARENNLKLDKKYPAMGYEFPASDIGTIPSGEDTFEWNESLGNRMQVGSRIGVYDEENDEYINGTVERKDVSADIIHILFDDGEKSAIYMRKRRIRMLSENHHPSLDDLKTRMRLSLDPSLPNYIICGGGVTKAHSRKHAHRLLEHYIDVVLDDEIKTSASSRGDNGSLFRCQKVLQKLEDDDIDFIQWNATIGGFGKASKKEIKKKIVSTFQEKLEERAKMPQEQAQPPMIPFDGGPIQHVLLIKGGRSPPKIPRKQVSDDPFLAMGNSRKRHRRMPHAWESGLVSMERAEYMTNESILAQSASALIQLGQEEVFHNSVWNSDIFDDAPEEKWQEHQASLRLSQTQPMLKQIQEEQKRKYTLPPEIQEEQKWKCTLPVTIQDEQKWKSTGLVSTNREQGNEQREMTISKFLAKCRGTTQHLFPSGSVPTTKKRGPSAESAKKSSKKSAKAPPPKKPRGSPKTTNSANRKITLCQRHFESWHIALEGATKFRKKHGHCNIPSQYPPDPKLATWAKRQRHQYQLYLRRNPKCTLTPDRIQALGKIGFCFDHQQIKWLQRFEELKAYAKEHGHCRVPVSGKEKKLGAWVKHQKAQRRLYDDGQPSFITKNRISMLDSVGMVWRMR